MVGISPHCNQKSFQIFRAFSVNKENITKNTFTKNKTKVKFFFKQSLLIIYNESNRLRNFTCIYSDSDG